MCVCVGGGGGGGTMCCIDKVEEQIKFYVKNLVAQYRCNLKLNVTVTVTVGWK